MKKFLLIITIFLCMTPTVFGADYVFNGETLPATSSYEDTYYGVETMKNILDDLGVPYNDSTLLGYTYHTNQFMKYYIQNIDTSTTALNVCFLKNNNEFVALPSNGGFSETLDYIYYEPYFTGELNSATKFDGFDNFIYNSVNSITGVNTKRLKLGLITSSKYNVYDTPGYSSASNENYQTSSQLYFKNTLAPSNAFMITGKTPDTGYGYYYLTNQIRFTESPEPEPEPEFVPNSIDSTYGYLWSPSVNGDVEINLDYKEQNQLVHAEHFIGSSLQSTFVFYYYSGDDIISFNDYVTRNAYLETEFGTWYDFYIKPENLEYLPNNTNFYLNIYATLGQNSATVVKNFLAFHTVDNSSEGDTSGDTGGDTESGDNNENIQENIQNGIVQGNTDYWGSSGDLTGEKQEELISGKVDELTEQISGDLAENEIFGILQKYEDKIFGGFTGEEDFKIEWNNVSYAGGVIIPKGEINFSKMCRENETLGNVKTTVNIILGFFLLSNCVIYLYNLLLATLGIDNPYLYETPPEQVETVTFDTNMNTGETMMTQTTKKRDGTTFRLRRKL